MRKMTNPIYCEVIKTPGKSKRQSIEEGDYNWWDAERICKGWVDTNGSTLSYCGTEEMLLEHARKNAATMWLIPAKKAFQLGAKLN